MLKGEKATLFRLSQPLTVHTIIKRTKHIIVLDNETRWNSDGTPQDDNFIDHHIKPYTEEDQSFLNESVTVSSPLKISRVMRVKRVQKTCLVLDYGADSVFSIKFSLTDGTCMSDSPAWHDFSLTTQAISEYLGRNATDDVDT